MIGGITEGKEGTSGAEKAEAPKEQMKKAPAQKTESKKKSESAKGRSRATSSEDSSESSSEEAAFSGSLFDRDEQHKQNIEAAWEDIERRGF